jgi:hypothetical protein
MTLAVKPDDEDFVLIGGTSLFRSRDGFAIASVPIKEETWVGGYAYDTVQQLALPSYNFPNILYRNSHPDYHITVFDPFDDNTVWTGHDGGLSLSSDITASPVSWDSRNNGYNVTQFYTVTISKQAGDNRIMGGTQDNATPFIRWRKSAPAAALNVGLGDGSYAYLGTNHAYISPQRGRIRRLNYDAELNPIPTGLQEIPIIFPPSPKDRLFIHPFVVDPQNEDVMYFPLQHEIWRQDQLSAYPVMEDTVLAGWQQIVDLSLTDNYQITTLAVSSDPAHVLYFAVSSCCDLPLLYRLTEATTEAPQPVRRTLPNAVSGAYVHSIAVNPTNADEILVVLSNYNVAGLYHSTNGGLSFSVVEGNLEGSSGLPGPSLRSVTVLPFDGATYYFVGTSTGLYATTEPDGRNTVWLQQAGELIGNTVVESITSRSSDGVVAVATHGRGLFVGTVQGIGSSDVDEPSLALTLEQNYPNPANASTSIPFSLSSSGTVTITLYNVRGREIRKLLSGHVMNAGRYEIPVTLSSLASGMYLYNLQVITESPNESTMSQTRKLLVLK